MTHERPTPVPSEAEAARRAECPARMVGQCALVNNQVGVPVSVGLPACTTCLSEGGPDGPGWGRYASNAIAALRSRPDLVPEAFRPLFEKRHGPLGATQPSNTDRWMKVRPTWEMAQSFLLSIKSRGVGALWGGGERVDLTIKGRRHVSCFGSTLDGTRVSDPCPSLARSADGVHHFCNDCGCGDKELAHLDGQEGEYTKLDYPYLQCPRGRDGFDVPPSCSGGGAPAGGGLLARVLRVDGTTPEHDLKWLLKWADEIRPHRVVEIGTYKGRTATLLAAVSGWVDTVDDFSGGWVRGAEPTSPPFEEETRRNLKDLPNVQIHKRGDDQDLIRSLGRGRADLVFIDGNHSYEAVVRDLHLALELRTPGGVICGHDWAMPDVQDAVRSVLGEPTAVGDWMWRWEGERPTPIPVSREPTPDIIFSAESCGMGDVILQCWIAEGINRTGKRAAFYTNNGAFQALIRMFGQRLTSRREGAITLGGHARHYHYELRVDKGHTPRARLWASLMPIKATPARPTFTPPQEGVPMVDDFVRSAEGRPIALLFPMADHVPRRWPLGRFVDLAWTLEALGWYTLALFGSYQGDVHVMGRFPRYWYGIQLGTVAALGLKARVSVCNDSGPAHLIGTAGGKVVALGGHTIRVFEHDENVTLLKGTTACTGCLFRQDRGFRAACDVQCESLASISVGTVLEEVKRYG